MRSIMQLTQAGVVFSGTTAELERQRVAFDRQHCLHLPALLEAGLLRTIQQRLARADFGRVVYPPADWMVAVEETTLRDDSLLGWLLFLLNDPKLLQLIQHLTGCDPIGCFTGRVYRKLPGHGHFDTWHNDNVFSRMIGLSLNLSTEVYRGGLFQVRERDSQRLIHEVANTGYGDAVIFRIAASLEHRQSDLEGSAAKTACAGWFRAQPDYQSTVWQKFFSPAAAIPGDQALRAVDLPASGVDNDADDHPA